MTSLTRHRIIKAMLIAAILLGGLILYKVFVPSPVIAQECSTYDVVFGKAVENGMKPYAIPAANLAKTVDDVEAITGDDYGEVTRGFLLFVPGKLVVGFEHDGCLYAPIEIARSPETGA